MPEDEVVVKVRADVEELKSGLDQGKGALKDFGDETERTEKRSVRMNSKMRDTIFTLAAIRGAFSLARISAKEFGVESEVLDKTLRALEITTYAAIVASKLYAIAKKSERLASIGAAMAKFLDYVAASTALSFGFMTALAIGVAFAAIAAIEAATPRAQFGGVVPARPGGTVVRVGEAGRDEAIIPLGRNVGGPITVNMTVQTNDPDELVRLLGRKIQTLKAAGY